MTNLLSDADLGLGVDGGLVGDLRAHFLYKLMRGLRGAAAIGVERSLAEYDGR